MAKNGNNDKMVKDIRGSLKNAFKTSGKYFTGAAKLFLVSGKEMISSNMPVLSPMIETNADLLRDTAKFLRNPADAINRQVTRVLESEPARALKDVAKNAMQDLKSGTLYDRDRMRDEWGDGVNSLLNNFGDTDMSGFDENGDFTLSDDEFDDFDKLFDLAGIQEDAANERTGATIDAIGAATTAIVESESANSQNNIRLSMKQHSQTMSGIQNMITMQSATFQGMADSAKASLELTRETHQQIMESMNNITSLLEKVVENTSPVVKEVSKPDNDSIYGTYGALDIKKYLKSVAKNVDNYFGISSTIGMATGGNSLTDLINLYRDNPFQLITDAIVKSIVPDKMTKAMNRTSENISSFFPALFQKLGERGQRGKETGNWKDIFAGMFGVSNTSNSSIDTRMRDVSAKAEITNRTLTSIEVVMPMWLSKIYSAISGDELKVYNYSTGKLETASSIIAGSSHASNDLANRMGSGSRTIMNRSRAYNFEDPEMEKEFQDYVYQYLQNMAENNSFINPFESAKTFRDKMPGIRGNKGTEELYYNLLTGIMRNMPQNELMSLGREIYSARNSRDTAVMRMNDEMRENGQLAALMGWVDDRVMRKLSSASNNSKYGLNDTESSEIVTADKKEILKAGGTQATNLWLSDISSILRRGIVTYTYIIGGVKRNKDGTTTSVPTDVADFIKIATDDAKSESDKINAITSRIRKAEDDEKRYKADQLTRRQEYMQTVDPNRPFTPDQRFIPAGKVSQRNITADMADEIQRAYVVSHTEEGESGNQWVEYARREQKKEAAGKAVTDKVMNSVKDELNELGERSGLKGFFNLSKEVAKTPFNLFTTGLNVIDGMMFKALYGEDAIYELNDGSMPGLVTSLQNFMKNNLTSLREWFTNDLLKPLKESLLGDDGLLGKTADKINDTLVTPLKDSVSDKIKGFSDKAFGTYDKNTKTFTGGKMSNKLNDITSKVRGVVNPKPQYYQDDNGSWYDKDGNIVDASVVVSAMAEYQKNQKKGTLLDRILYGKYSDQERKGVNETLLTDTFESNGLTVSRTVKDRKYSGLLAPFKWGVDTISDLMFGSDVTNEVTTGEGTTSYNGKDIEKSKYYNQLKKEISDGIPDMAIGAGVGVLGSLFLPGGPILGAILGSGIGLARSSETFKHFLFGDQTDVVKTDKFGNPVLDKDGKEIIIKNGSRKGGLISEQVYQGIQQFAPKIGKGALIGAIAGGVGLLPFGMGPAIGALFGSMGGMINASTQFQRAIWGDPEDESEEGRKKGLISKDFREKAKKALKDYLPAGITGGAIGAALGSGLGLIPGLSLLPTGPILGILGSMTGLASADRFNKFFFGDEVETDEPVKDKDGKVIGTKKVKTRQGGIFNKMFEGARDKVLTPVADAFDKAGKAVGKWFNEEVFKPFNEAIEPLKDSIRSAGEAVWDKIKGIGDTIMHAIDETFNAEPKKFMKEHVWDPLKNFTNKLFKGIGTIIGKILSAPFKALEFLVTGGKTIGGVPVDEVIENMENKRKEKQEEHDKDKKDKNTSWLSKIWKRAGASVKKNTSDLADQAGKFAEGMESISFRDKKYHQDEHGTWYDENGKKAGLIKSVSLNGELNRKKREERKKNKEKDKDKDKTDNKSESAEPTNPNEPAPQNASSDKSSESSETVKPSSPPTKVKVKTAKPAKTKNSSEDYLKGIDKNTSKIYDEIKGQLGGTGWELKYIRTLLTKQYGGLKDSELPEEMEGSKRSVRKRRNIFTRTKDLVSGVFGKAKDSVTKVFDVVLSPFRLVGNIMSGIAKGLKQAGSLLVGTVKLAGEAVGQAVVGVVKMIAGAAKGIGEALGNTVSLLSGVIKDATLSLTAFTRGVIETAATIAPEILTSVFNGAKWVVSKTVTGAGKLLRAGGRGIKGIFTKIRDRRERKAAKNVTTDASGNPIPTTSTILNGGYLDGIKEPVSFALSDGKDFPVVAVRRGIVIGKKPTHAIPVYIVGDKSKKDKNKSSGNTDDKTGDDDEAPKSLKEKLQERLQAHKNEWKKKREERDKKRTDDLKNRIKARTERRELRDKEREATRKGIEKEISDKLKGINDKYKAKLKAREERIAEREKSRTANVNKRYEEKDRRDAIREEQKIEHDEKKAIQKKENSDKDDKNITDKQVRAEARKDKREERMMARADGLRNIISSRIRRNENRDVEREDRRDMRRNRREERRYNRDEELKEILAAREKRVEEREKSRTANLNKRYEYQQRREAIREEKKIERKENKQIRKDERRARREERRNNRSLSKDLSDALSNLFGNTRIGQIVKGIIGIGKFVVSGVKSLVSGFKKLFSKDKSQHITIDGGTLDGIKNVVSVTMSNNPSNNQSDNGTNIPTIPVGDNAEATNVPAGENAPESSKTSLRDKLKEKGKNLLRIFKRNYFKVDKATEDSTNAKDAYDKAIANAQSMEEVEGIKAANQLNANTAIVTQSDSKKSDDEEGFLDKLLNGKVGAIVKKVLPFLATLIGGSGATTLLTKLGLIKSTGTAAATVTGTSALGSTVAAGILPAVGTVNAISEGEYGSAASYATRGATRMASTLLTTTGVTGMAVQGSTKVAKTAGGKLMQKAGIGVAKGVENVAGKLSTKLVEGAKKFISSKTVQSLLKKYPKAGEKVLKVFSNKIDDIALTLGASTAKELLKKLNLVILVAQAVIDFGTGMHNAAQYFDVSASDVTFGYRISAGFAKALSGLAFGLIPVSWLSQAIFGIFSNEEAKEELKEKQTAMTNYVSNINNLNNTSLSVDEFQEYYDDDGNLKKSGLFHMRKVYDPISGKWVLKKDADNYKLNTGDSSHYSGGFGPGGYGRGVATLNQTSSKYNKNCNDMAMNGCGPTAAAMVSTAYGKKGDPIGANKMSYGMGMRGSDGGTNPAFFSKYASSQGFGMSEGPNSSSMVQSNLSKGNPVVLMGKGGAFGSGMHYLVADGADKNGNVNIKDPLRGSKTTKLDDLMSNTKNTIYSYGRGKKLPMATAVSDSGGTKTSGVNKDAGNIANAQASLVNWMKSKIGKLKYSIYDVQDPDQGTASCASTVGWAYRKALGGDFETDRLSASSTAQSKDSRFKTIYSKGSTPFDEKLLQPGDILYIATGSDPNDICHTEMYAGNGEDLSHGGPGDGPTIRPLNDWRKARIIKARRYNGFVDNNTVTYNDVITTGTAAKAASTTGSTGTTSSDIETSERSDGSILTNALADIDDVFSSISSKFGGILSGIFGESEDEEGATDTTTDGDTKSTTNTDTIKGNNTGSKIFNYLTDKGFTKQQAAGIMGNLFAESGLRSDNLEDSKEKTLGYTDKTYTDAVNNKSYKNFSSDSAGYGLAQWTADSRKAGLYNSAISSKKNIEDLGLQLDYLWNELNNGYKSSVLDPIKKTSTTKAASKIFMQKFEVPQGYKTNAKIKERAEYADQMYNQYANNEETGSGEWGTGANVSAMNNKVAKINNLINSTRAEANTESVISEVTDRITKAVGEGTDSADNNMLKVIAQTMAIMVEHLAAIRENTANANNQSNNTTNVTNITGGNRTATYPNGESDVENIGKAVIDRLTSK